MQSSEKTETAEKAGKSAKVEIMHVGNVHLNGIFGSIGKEKSRECREALLSGFCDEINKNADDGVSVAVISGDLFDNNAPDINTVRRLLSTFERNSGVRFIITEGKEEAGALIFRSSILPKNVTVLDEQNDRFDTVTKDGTPLTFIHVSAIKKYSGEAEKKNGLSVIVGYKTLKDDVAEGEDALSANDVAESGADLCLLTGEHRYEGIKTLGRTVYENTGFFCGHDFSEEGYGGYTVIVADFSDGKSISAKRKNFISHRYVKVSADVTGARTADDAIMMAKKYVNAKKYGGRDSIRLTYTGEVYPTVVIPMIQKEIEDELFSLETVNKTIPIYDCEEIRKSQTIIGELFRAYHHSMTLKNTAKRQRAADEYRAAYIAITGKNINNI